MQPRQYFERQIESIDEIVKWFDESGRKDKTISKLYAAIIQNKLKELRYNNVDIDYKSIEQKIKPYL